MGIKGEEHQKSILVSISQLQNESYSDALGESGAPLADCSTPAHHHNLRTHSFPDLRRCDKCRQFLRGFIQQGQYCVGESRAAFLVMAIMIAIYIFIH